MAEQTLWNSDYNNDKGYLLVGNGTRPIDRIIGSDGQMLTAQSANADGVEWAFQGTAVPGFAAYQSVTLPNFTGVIPSVTLPFDTEIFDTFSNYNPVTGIFTASVAGLYFFSTIVSFSGITAAFNQVRVIFSLNAALGYGGIRWNTGNFRVAAGGLAAVSGATTVQLGVGDQFLVDITVSQDTKTVDVVGDSNPSTYFAGMMIG